MRREFSAGVVLVRRMRGRWWLAAVRPQGKREGTWALPKGLVDAGETPAETALCARAFEETGVAGRLGRKLGDVRYVYTWDGERVFKVVSFFLAHAARGRIGELPAGNGGRGRRGALAPARRRLQRSSPTRASARWPRRPLEILGGEPL